MKRPVVEHKERLMTWRAAIAREQTRLDSIALVVTTNTRRADALEAQIARAEKEGRDGFDAEKYNKRRGK